MLNRENKHRIDLKYYFWSFFYVHLALYIAINILLITTNVLLSPQQLWFVIPLAGWGVWVFAHFFITFALLSDSAKQWRSGEIRKLTVAELKEGLTEEEAGQRATIKLFFWTFFYFHAALYIGGNTLMILINLLVDRTFLWSLIPLIGWSLWLLFHYLLTFLCLGDQVRNWRDKQLKKLAFTKITLETRRALYREAFLRFFFWNIFLLHLGLYVLCNVFMFTIDMLTDQNTLWFIWPLISWGIFLLAHYGFTYATSSEQMVKWREEHFTGT